MESGQKNLYGTIQIESEFYFMEFYSLNQIPCYVDDFYWRELSDGSDKAIVIHNPQNALIMTPFYPSSRKTLDEHIEYIRTQNIKSAIVIAEDISFIKDCPSLERIMVFPAISATKFDYSPLYALPNIKWLQCQTVYGKNEENITNIDYSNFPQLERVLIEETGHLNVDKAKKVTTLRFYAFPKEKSMVGKIPTSVLDFSITNSPVQSLDGIEVAEQIFKLELQYNRNLKDISALKNIKGTLKHLEIYNCGKITDFSVLQTLSNLEYLVLRGSNKIENLSFLQKMPKLKYFKFTMNVADGDLSLCESIPHVEIKNHKHYSHRNIHLPKTNI